MSVPARIAFTPDSRWVTWLHSAEGGLVRSLWAHDIETGERRVLAGPDEASTSEDQLSREEELRRERARLRELGVTDYQFAKEAERPTLLVPSGGGLQASVGGEPLRLLAGTEGALDARLSTDGHRVAFVLDNELWVMALDDDSPRQLTFGAGDAFTHGVAEFIAQEELGRAEGFWWSPDGTRIAYEEADSRHIPLYPIVHQGAPGIDVETHRYPFAGQPNAKIRLGVLNLDTGETVWMDLGANEDVYLARVHWRPQGDLVAQVLERDQRSSRLLRFHPETGAASVLLEERQEPWYNLHDDARFLDSGEFVWSSERSGFRHVVVYDGDGRLQRQLTQGDWVVTRLVDVHEASRTVFFEATRESPLERHLYAVPFDGGEIRQLTEAPGYHQTVVAPDGSMYVDVFASVDAAPTVSLVQLNDGSRQTLFDNDSLSSRSLGLPAPEFVELEAADGSVLHGAIYKPDPVESGRRYPLIVCVYGGPHAQTVLNHWSETVDLRAQYLAQQGYVVFKLDNRISANRGVAFEAHINRLAGFVEVEDQVAGVRFMAAQPYVDRERVGVYGWSYGGYVTLMCLCLAPEVFRAGVAGAPVTHWDGYDTAYSERYMGPPQDNADGYERSSVMAHVEKLEGDLLLVHGGIDENVHFRHTARLIVALSRAQKPYELLLFPEERHMPRDAQGLEYQERRLVEFFDRRL
jgi:dipeptidyl-peptidase-4